MCVCCVFQVPLWPRGHQGTTQRRTHVSLTHHQWRAECHITRQDDNETRDRRPAENTPTANERRRGRLPPQLTKRAREHDQAQTKRRMNPDSEAWRVCETGMVRATRRTPKDTKKLPASDERPRSRANMATCNCAAVKTCSVRGARKKTRVRYWMGGLRVARRANFTHTHVDKKIAQLHN